MTRTDWGVITTVIALTAVLVVAVVKKNIAAAGNSQMSPPIHLEVRENTLYDSKTEFYGDPRSPYTLVEFFDYQCPPCRRNYPAVHTMIDQNKGRVRMVTHHFPLSMHPYAMPAAIFAEASREQGKFWEVHDALFTDKDGFESEHLKQVAKSLHLDAARMESAQSKSAKARVQSDLKMAQELHIDGTPTFLFCTPDKGCYKLTSLNQIGTLMSK